jgi:hypothetical protein
MLFAFATPVMCWAQPLPTVYVDYPSGSFYHQCESYIVYGVPSLHIKKHRVHTCYDPSPLKVRPTTISLSVDGNSSLSSLDWSGWTATSASGSGLQYVRCFGGSTDPNCAAKEFGYNVPVEVQLRTPVATSRGVVFTVLTVTRRGSPTTWCLPPAAAC